MRPVLGFAVLVHIAQFFGAFWRLFGPFLGHIVELERTKGPLVTGTSGCTWDVAVVCLPLAVLNP